jgi:glycosyltransferase involved in cell wall biosynthesis
MGSAEAGAADPGGPERGQRPLRVVLVEFLPSGGMYQFSFQFADALARAGHQVTLITGPDPELRSRTPGLEVLELLPTWHPNAGTGGPRPGRFKLRRAVRALQLMESWRRVLRYVRQHRPDVVQFGELRYILDTAALLVVARLGRAGVLVDVAHNPLPYDVAHHTAAVEKGGRLTTFLLARAYRACDLVLVLGEGPRNQLLKHFPTVRRAVVCGHGDYASILPTAQTPPPSTAGPRALFFGTWTRYKDLPLLLDAFALARLEIPEARLTLAGPVMPDVDLADIESKAARVGHVDLRPGYLPMEDVPQLFRAHRVVLFTYATVNISGSVHMAYTFGRPVIATDVGSMADVVDNGVTGLLTRPDAEAVGAALVAVLGNPELADRMGEAARAHSAGDSWKPVSDAALAGYRAAEAGAKGGTSTT